MDVRFPAGPTPLPPVVRARACRPVRGRLRREPVKARPARACRPVRGLLRRASRLQRVRQVRVRVHPVRQVRLPGPGRRCPGCVPGRVVPARPVRLVLAAHRRRRRVVRFPRPLAVLLFLAPVGRSRRRPAARGVPVVPAAPVVPVVPVGRALVAVPVVAAVASPVVPVAVSPVVLVAVPVGPAVVRVAVPVVASPGVPVVDPVVDPAAVDPAVDPAVVVVRSSVARVVGVAAWKSSSRSACRPIRRSMRRCPRAR